MCYLMVIAPLPAIHMHVSAINIIFMYNIFQKIEMLRARVEQQKNERDKLKYLLLEYAKCMMSSYMYLVLIHGGFLFRESLLSQRFVDMAVSRLVEPRITSCCSERGTGGRQGGHSRLYIGSIAALGR